MSLQNCYRYVCRGAAVGRSPFGSALLKPSSKMSSTSSSWRRGGAAPPVGGARPAASWRRGGADGRRRRPSARGAAARPRRRRELGGALPRAELVADAEVLHGGAGGRRRGGGGAVRPRGPRAVGGRPRGASAAAAAAVATAVDAALPCRAPGKSRLLCGLLGWKSRLFGRLFGGAAADFSPTFSRLPPAPARLRVDLKSHPEVGSKFRLEEL